MKLSIIDAQHTIFEGAVSEAILPAAGGELAILDNHEPIFVALQRGKIRLELMAQQVSDTRAKIFPIKQGVARMKRNELVILVE